MRLERDRRERNLRDRRRDRGDSTPAGGDRGIRSAGPGGRLGLAAEGRGMARGHRTMSGGRVALAFAVAALAAVPSCASSPAPPIAGAGRLPAALRALLLNDDHPTMPPVAFDHGLHAGRAACSSCHHDIAAGPAALPAACSSCHLTSWLEPEHDEAAAHDHSGPPDL